MPLCRRTDTCPGQRHCNDLVLQGLDAAQCTRDRSEAWRWSSTAMLSFRTFTSAHGPSRHFTAMHQFGRNRRHSGTFARSTAAPGSDANDPLQTNAVSGCCNALRRLPGYSITSSGVASSFRGKPMPKPRAVARLMTNSNLVARATGRSVGFGHARLRCAIIVRASSSELAFIVRLSPVTRLRNV